MADFILSLDQGTTSSRAIVFDHGGQVVSVAQKEFKQIFPQPGWVEHDPIEIWSTQLGVAAEAITKAGLTVRDINSIGITNQRETAIVWDRGTGKPVYNAIVWQDRRTSSYCDRLKAEGHEAMIRSKTGLVIEIRRAIRRLDLTQKEAATRMGLTQPKVSSMMRGDFSNLSERKLMDCLTRLGYDIKIEVKPAKGSVGQMVLAVA
jgi:glycerol kinase